MATALALYEPNLSKCYIQEVEGFFFLLLSKVQLKQDGFENALEYL